MGDQTDGEFGPGGVAIMQPGHRAWVGGNEPNLWAVAVQRGYLVPDRDPERDVAWLREQGTERRWSLRQRVSK